MITNPSNFRDLHDCYDFIEAGHLSIVVRYLEILQETGLGRKLL